MKEELRGAVGAEAAGDEFDPLEGANVRNPHAAYGDLRARCPVAHSERWGGFWLLTRYEDVVAATTDHRTFVNSVQNVVPKVRTTGKRPPLHTDPPEHTRYRRALNPPFHPRRIAQLEPTIRELSVRMLEPYVAKGGGDLSEEVATQLPILVLAHFLNAPESAAARIRSLSERFVHAFKSDDEQALEAESQGMYAFARELMELRRAEPLDPAEDVPSALLAAAQDGELEEELLVGSLRQLVIAGHLAVTLTLGSCVLHLAEHPELQAYLRAHPERLPAAVHELLRLYTPNQGFARTTTREVELHGRLIRPGEPVALGYPSANRDEEVFADPDEFVWDRPQRTLTFGNGVHKCLGEPLARLELEIALEELLTRTSSFELAGEVEFARWPEWGPTRLPLRVVSR